MKNHSLIISLLIFLLLFNLSFNQSFSFGIELHSFEERCLTEYYKSQTVIIFELSSSNPIISLEVKSPDGTTLYHNINTTSLFSLTTQSNGFYSVCAKNNGKYSSDINLLIKSGISAHDFSSVAKVKI